MVVTGAAAAFLLKVRNSRRNRLEDANSDPAAAQADVTRIQAPAGAWPPQFQGRGRSARTWQPGYGSGYLMISPLSPPAFANIESLYQLLMPANVQVVPLLLIAWILVAYVVTIGPIDYFLLGLLRLRRFTWPFFLLVTVGFAAFTLWLSQWYLGTNDSRRALEICDVVRGGTIARSTRIELNFLGQARELAAQVQNGFFAQIGLGRSTAPMTPGMAPQPDTLLHRPDSVHRPLSQPVPRRPIASPVDTGRESLFLDRNAAVKCRKHDRGSRLV